MRARKASTSSADTDRRWSGCARRSPPPRLRHRAHRARLLLARPGPRHLGQARRRRLRAGRPQALQRPRQEEARQDPGRLPEPAEQEAPQARQRQEALQEQDDQGAQQVDQEGAQERLQAAQVTAAAEAEEEEGEEAPRTSTSSCCGSAQYKSIQDAVTAAHNNDRIEIMPGLYTEPKSRAKPTNDPACDQYKITNDKNQAGAVSYAYQFHCPNDQNLIAVLGRALTNTPVPQPPLLDRHVIPDAGACIRCNLQIQGTGVSPDDVTIDAGNTASGDGPPIGSVKDVGIRADRADGFVLDNIKVRHAKEHDIYVIETDGSHLNRFKAPYAGEYGVLTFVADHSLIENCDAWGSRRLRPSTRVPAPTSARRVPPDQRRYGTEIRNCDMRHSTAGLLGDRRQRRLAPQQRVLRQHRWASRPTSSRRPAIPASPRTRICSRTTTSTRTTSTPTCRNAAPGPEARAQRAEPGLLRRRSRPSRFRSGQACGSPAGTRTWSATTASGTTGAAGRCSSRSPTRSSATTRTTRWPAAIRQRPCRRPRTATSSTATRWAWLPNGSVKRNGVDFWWDQGGVSVDPTLNTGNCWYSNTGPDGTAASVTGLPSPSGAPPNNLPSNCADSPSVGAMNGQVAEILTCSTVPKGDPSCPWFTTPPKP